MPPRRLRLDAELVRRKLARSREHASELIAARRVTVAGVTATKPATGVTTDAAIVVAEDPGRPDYVSRGGHKLAGALTAFAPLGLSVKGRRCLDAGASPGGFTDVHLQLGAGQGEAVGDLWFISLVLGRDALLGVTARDGDLALLVKPQFEVGRERVGKGGVVRDPALRAEAVNAVAAAAAARGWGARAVTTSPLPGPSGNIEFFLWLRRGDAEITPEEIERAVRDTVGLDTEGLSDASKRVDT